MGKKRTIVSMIGRPGSGKSSLAERSASLLGMKYISSGDIAREICDRRGDDSLSKGDMGPENEVRQGVADAIRSNDCDIILDGMPRHPEQLEWFKQEFSEFDLRYVVVDVPQWVCKDRMLLRGRELDVQSIEKRLGMYETMTNPILQSIWASTFSPSPYAEEDNVAVDFCRFLLSSRTVPRRVKIKLLEDHPLYNKSEEEIEIGIGGDEATKAFLYKKYKGDAGLDIFISKPVVIPARGKANISTSIIIEIPPFYWYGIDKRSSTYYRRNILVIEAVIDNGYRGELFCTVHNPTDHDIELRAGESIAQIIFQELVGYDFQFEFSDKLTETDRQDRGFGSTTDHKNLIEELYNEKGVVQK